jgi:hypothetical protein
MTVQERDAYAKKALKIFQNRQVTEQATAIARARTAKQFEEFLSDDNNRLFPNLRWLPSSAVVPRSSHMEFYHHVWAKTDPFWATDSPGQEWNCQCDVAETADSETNNAAVPQPRPKKGLEGNPGIKEINGNPNPHYGQAFTDNASYIAKAKNDVNVVKEVANLYWKDSKSDLLISAMPDMKELIDNVQTGKMLVQNYPDLKVSINPHYPQELFLNTKNPEYKINNSLADAKRITKYKGISNGFANAKKQGCSIVIIDFNKHFNTTRPANLDKIAGYLLWRKSDFNNDIIRECYICYRDKTVMINKLALENKETLKTLLEGLMP